MKINGKAFVRVVSVALLAMLWAGPVNAQVTKLEGSVIASDGKSPYPNAILVAKNAESGKEVETKSDKQGKFSFLGLRPGAYIITVKVYEKEVRDLKEVGTSGLASPVTVKEVIRAVLELKVTVALTDNEPLLINFKDFVLKQTKESAEAAENRRKSEEKFQGMKEHFDLGRASLEQAMAAKGELQKTPAAERGPLTEKLALTSTTAINELEAAQKAAAATEPNLHIVLSNLGQAYDLAGRYDDAVAAYSKASELKPENASYLQGLGTAQARAGKVADAMATCAKATALPPAPGTTDSAQVTASCYGNIGIILQNASKMKDSIEPLKQATTVNPKNADYWFLLAGALMNTMDSKMEGNKMIAIVQPGTAEAYQKYLELAPTGRFAQEAKDNLETLKLLGVGIDTKVTTKKKKP